MRGCVDSQSHATYNTYSPSGQTLSDHMGRFLPVGSRMARTNHGDKSCLARYFFTLDKNDHGRIIYRSKLIRVFRITINDNACPNLLNYFINRFRLSKILFPGNIFGYFSSYTLYFCQLRGRCLKDPIRCFKFLQEVFNTDIAYTRDQVK